MADSPEKTIVPMLFSTIDLFPLVLYQNLIIQCKKKIVLNSSGKYNVCFSMVLTL